MHRCLHPILVAALLLCAARIHAVPPEQIKADEQAMAGAGLKTDGPALLAFFKARTPGDRTIEDIETLVRKLGDERFRIRQKASDELIRIGAQALRPLREHENSKDPEISRRVKECLTIIERSGKADMLSAAARLLGDRKPEGAVEAILAFLPFTDEGSVTDDLHEALASAGFKQGKADEALRKALEDKHAIRRAAAAEAFIRAGSDEDRKALRKLFKDADARVRTRVALAFVERKDREAVGVMIGGMHETSQELFWRIEELLFALAGDRAPTTGAGTTEAERRGYQAVWSKWWKDNEGKINLAALDEARKSRGLTLVVQLDNRNVAVGGRMAFQGRVFEVGRDGKPRWEIANLNYPLDAQVVGPDRVLVVEYRSRTVTERNFKGEVLWQHQGNGLTISAQRLENGNTLIVSRNDVVEVNKANQEVFRHNGQLVIGARRLKNGDTIVLDRNGTCSRLNAKGQVVKSFQVPAVLTVIGSHFDAMPNGNVVLPLYNQNKVVEISPDGKEVWSYTCPRPTAVSRLPNGNTLIASRYSNAVLEVDRAGKKVWEFTAPNGTAIVARRR